MDRVGVNHCWHRQETSGVRRPRADSLCQCLSSRMVNMEVGRAQFPCSAPTASDDYWFDATGMAAAADHFGIGSLGRR
jgi:hypothetical protein